MGRALKNIGERDYFSDESEDFKQLLSMVGNSWKMVIGVHAKTLNDNYFQDMTGVPKVQLVMDSTYFIPELFDSPGDMNYVLCHDRNYVDYVKKQFGIMKLHLEN